jgi:hypothetical protein
VAVDDLALSGVEAPTLPWTLSRHWRLGSTALVRSEGAQSKAYCKACQAERA